MSPDVHVRAMGADRNKRNRYYIPPWYPNGFASGKPADYFTEAQAREALDAADQIIRFCERHLPGPG